MRNVSLDVIDQQCTAAGWEFLNENNRPAAGNRRSYRRNGSTIYILESSGTVTLHTAP
jgi:hypothetical protein